jgi:hypothetical protein
MLSQNNQLFAPLNKFAPVFRDYDFLTVDRHECAADRADVDFIFEQLSKVPYPIKRIILNNAFKLKERQKRNLYILNTTAKVVSLLPEKLRHSMTVDDEEIRTIATDCADRCRRIALHHNVKGQIYSQDEIFESNAEDIYLHLTEYTTTFYLKAININTKGITLKGGYQADDG